MTIEGVTRSATGEADAQSERSEIAGTAAEAQAFKRACAMFGLGRYLYSLPSLWVEFDAERKQFTQAAQARLANVAASHSRRNGAQEPSPPAANVEFRQIPSVEPTLATVETVRKAFHAAGKERYNGSWEEKRREFCAHFGVESSNDLTVIQARQLIAGMQERVAA